MKRYFVLCLFSLLCLSALTAVNAATVDQKGKGNAVPAQTKIQKEDAKSKSAVAVPVSGEKEQVNAAVQEEKTITEATSVKEKEITEPASAQYSKTTDDIEKGVTESTPAQYSKTTLKDSAEPSGKLSTPEQKVKKGTAPAKTVSGKKSK